MAAVYELLAKKDSLIHMDEDDSNSTSNNN